MQPSQSPLLQGLHISRSSRASRSAKHEPQTRRFSRHLPQPGQTESPHREHVISEPAERQLAHIVELGDISVMKGVFRARPYEMKFDPEPTNRSWSHQPMWEGIAR